MNTVAMRIDSLGTFNEEEISNRFRNSMTEGKNTQLYNMAAEVRAHFRLELLQPTI